MKEAELKGLEPVGLSSKDVSCEQAGPPFGDLIMKSRLVKSELLPEYEAMNYNLEYLLSPPDDTSKNSGLEPGPTLEEANKNRWQLGHGDKGTSLRSRKSKNTSRSSVGSTRVLRSRSQDKPRAPEPCNEVAENGVNNKKKRKDRRKGMKKKPVNEFSRIRNHLRYLLHRMQYEQNLIDVYSGEGWKGQSLDKIKPEKELQRAKSEIFRCKLKIRDLFQRLDLSCAQGKFLESLYDSEGEIDSEDISCAKCGFDDVTVDNDIILCDGACDRGFHQFCLEPPLFKEDIPPDEEGWLCPGCDCKVDCIDLLNDSQGTNLSLTESWEKVFPEAAGRSKLDDNFGISSDDSEDDDYNPDGPAVSEKVQSEESNSDESDFSSTSSDSGNSQNDKQLLGSSSDDSEDDNYDPSAPDIDEQVNQESSSSDFTSDSEDLSVAFDDNISSCQNKGPIPSSSNHAKLLTGSNGERSKLGGIKGLSLSDELSYLLESAPAPVSLKRHVERLDYKKLNDETYGNVSSDSSDEDFTDATAPKKRNTNSGKIASGSPNGKSPMTDNGKNARDIKYDQNKYGSTSNTGIHEKLDEGTNSLPAKSQNGSSELGSNGQSTTRATCRRYGDAATQALLESFKKNQYPERDVKENLAKELGLSVQQVGKWFGHARWTSRRSSRMESSIDGGGRNGGTPLPQVTKKTLEPEPKIVAKDDACNGVENKEQPGASPGVIKCCSEDMRDLKFESPKSRRRKSKLELQTYGNVSSEDFTDEIVSSSSDEDFTDAAARKKRKMKSRKIASASINGKSPMTDKRKNARDIKYDQNKNETTPNKGIHKMLDKGTDSLPAKSQNGSSELGSNGQSITRSTYRRYGDAATQVSKWFEHARWSSRRSSRMESSLDESGRNSVTPLPQVNKKPLEPEPKILAKDDACIGGENKEQHRHSPDKIKCCGIDVRELKFETPKSGKRKSKLEPQTYGNVSSDSSDEDFTDAAARKKRKTYFRKIAAASPNVKSFMKDKGKNARDIKSDQNKNETTPNTGIHKKLDEGTNSLPSKSQNGSSEPGSSRQSTIRSTCRRYGDAATQTLLDSFKKNQYPDRDVKENLAKELGLSVLQVSKWFGHARWSSRHSSRMESSIDESVRNSATPLSQINEELLEPDPKILAKNAACNGIENNEASPDMIECCSGDVGTGNMVSKEGSGQKFVTPKSRKRNSKLESQASAHILSFEDKPNHIVQDNSPTAYQVRRSDRIQTRSRKSVA